MPDRARLTGAGPAGRKGLVTAVLLVAIAALATASMLLGNNLFSRPSPAAAHQAAAVSTPPAGRLYLSPAEGREAAQRGLAPAGTRSILATGDGLEFGEWRWDETGVAPGPIAVRVDLKRQLVSVYRGPDEIGTAVIVYGANGKETPRGRLPIRGKSRDYRSVTYDAPMPFSLWLREDGVALHGSSVAMGRATNGCIGVPVEFAEKLFAVASVGDVIEVIG